MKLFVRGDVDGFFAIALDNLVQLLLIPALCIGVVGMAPAMVFGRILPGIAVSYIAGNLFYAWQAHRLARRENRTDVCAMPFGLNTPTMIAYAFLVMLPARQLALARGVAAGHGGVAGRNRGLPGLGHDRILRLLRGGGPAAADAEGGAPGLAVGAGFAFLTLNFVFDLFAHPVVGIVTLGLALLFFFSGLRPRRAGPAALVILAVGTALAWATGLAPGPPWPGRGGPSPAALRRRRSSSLGSGAASSCRTFRSSFPWASSTSWPRCSAWSPRRRRATPSDASVARRGGPQHLRRRVLRLALPDVGSTSGTPPGSGWGRGRGTRRSMRSS
jgi:hypothetical protein